MKKREAPTDPPVPVEDEARGDIRRGDTGRNGSVSLSADQPPILPSPAKAGCTAYPAFCGLRKCEQNPLRPSGKNPRACCVSDTDGRILDCDPAFVELFGFESYADAVGAFIVPLYADASKYTEVLKQLKHYGKLKQHTCVRRKRDGVAIYLIEELVAEFDFEGHLARITACFLDPVACAEAKESDDHYRRIVETSNEGIWVVGADLRATYVNDVMARMLGYTSAEMLGMTFADLLHKNDVEDHRREMEKRRMGLPGKYLRRLRKKDGSTLWAIVSAVAMMDPEGRFTGSTAMCVDVTTLEQAREDLRESEERWSFALEGSDEGVWDWNLGTGELFLSNGMLDMLGSERDERPQGLDRLLRYIHTDDLIPFYDALKDHLEGTTHHLHFEHRLRRADGATLWVLSRGKVMERSEEGKPLRFIGTCADISDRKASEEALRRSEEHYRTILRTAMDGFHILDTGGRILEVNDAFSQMIGYSQDHLLRMSISDIDAEMDESQVASRVETVVAAGSRRFETRYRRQDGRILDVDVSVNYLPSDGGKLYCFVRDISQRKENERLLQESRELYRMVTESIGDIIALLDEEGAAQYVSPSIERITGWSAAEVLGRDPRELLHPDDLPQIRVIFAPLREGAVEIGFESRFLCKDGDYKWLEQTVRAVSAEDGTPPRFVLCAREITRRKLIEEELRQNEERYRHLFEMESDGLALVDIESEQVIEVNSSACRMYGYPREEILGKPLYTFSAEPEASRRTVFERRTMVLHRMHRKKSGTQFPVEISISYLTFKGRPSLIAAIRDVTDRKRLEEELLRSRKLDAMGILAGGIAHDFNNLMGIVLGNLEMADLDLPKESTVGRFLTEARKATLKSREITQRFLNLSTGGHLSKLVTDIAPVIKAAVGALSNEKDVPVRVDIPESSWKVRVDKREMTEALCNAMQNAIEVSPPGNEVRVRVDNVTAEELPVELGLSESRYIKIQISDRGEGISEDHLGRIFDPYFTTKQRGTRKGTGLGLAITHAVVSHHGGRIRVDSTPGKGTLFCIYLPAVS